jgi:hypothetical protein
MRDLVAARDAALEVVHHRSVQIAAETVGIVLAEQDRQHAVRARADATRHHLMRVYVAPYKTARRNAGLASIIALGIGAVAGWQPLQATIDWYSGVDPGSLPSPAGALLALTLLSLSAMFGLSAWRANAFAQTVENAIDDLSGALRDRAWTYNLLLEIGVTPGSSITKAVLATAVDEWTLDHGANSGTRLFRRLLTSVARPSGDGRVAAAQMARVIGSDEVVRLIVDRGMETQLLVETEAMRDGRAELVYTLRNLITEGGDR